MPIIEHYNLGSASADRYNTINELLYQLPDNTSNLITAADIRDAVFSLWRYIEDVQTLASQSTSYSIYYQNSNQTLISVGGIPSGYSFSTPKSMQEMWDTLLYPYVPPVVSLSISNSIREYGNLNPVNINWSVIKKSNNIISISLTPGTNSLSINPSNPTSTNGVAIGYGTHSSNPGPYTISYFDMVVNDGNQYVYTYATFSWMNRIYWGTVDLSIIDNPDLNMNPGASSLISSLITDNVIKSLTGSELSITKSKIYNNINGNGKYLLFAWPSNLDNAYNPIFICNGIVNTAFTRIRNNSPFTNNYGFTTNYEVWISNTPYHSPINMQII